MKTTLKLIEPGLPFTQSMSCNSLLTGGRVFCFMFGFVLFAKNEKLGYETEIFFCLHIITLIL
jgi:hypothetical protein